MEGPAREEHEVEKKKVLFVCVHNSARSQMAEEYMRKLGGENYEAESAGLEPGQLNPLVVEAMREEGVDLSGKQTQSGFDLYKAGNTYDFVITVCSKEAEEKCPFFPGVALRLNWPFADPAKLEGPHEEKLVEVRKIRDQIKERIEAFLKVFSDL